MFSTKTSTDVGMVPLIKQLHGKTNWRKKCSNKEGDAMTFKQPRSTFASFKARWIRTSLSLHLATFDSSSYRLLFQTMLLITEAIAQQSCAPTFVPQLYSNVLDNTILQ